MLAYVFWHAPRAEIVRTTYEQYVMAFHSALATSRPPGFHRSLTFRIPEVPWIPSRDGAYEDWYLVDDSSALDPLNDAAVSGVCQGPHDRVAAASASGAGGLYGLQSGEPDLEHGAVAVWMSKPDATPYEDFYHSLGSVIEQSGLALWRRHMVLGPTPEFCMRAPQDAALPTDVALRFELRLVWPGSTS